MVRVRRSAQPWARLPEAAAQVSARALLSERPQAVAVVRLLVPPVVRQVLRDARRAAPDARRVAQVVQQAAPAVPEASQGVQRAVPGALEAERSVQPVAPAEWDVRPVGQVVRDVPPVAPQAVLDARQAVAQVQPSEARAARPWEPPSARPFRLRVLALVRRQMTTPRRELEAARVERPRLQSSSKG